VFQPTVLVDVSTSVLEVLTLRENQIKGFNKMLLTGYQIPCCNQSTLKQINIIGKTSIMRFIGAVLRMNDIRHSVT